MTQFFTNYYSCFFKAILAGGTSSESGDVAINSYVAAVLRRATSEHMKRVALSRAWDGAVRKAIVSNAWG